MDILFLLIPLSLLLLIAIIWAFLWSVRSGQFDDLEGPAHRILMDDEGNDDKTLPKARRKKADREQSAKDR